MVRFILGGSGSGKTTYLLSDMKQTAANRQINDKGLLCYLVPEQFSLHSEQLLLRSRDAAMDIQVLSFNRLAYRLFAAIGNPPGKLIGEIGKQMLCGKILADIGDELVFYKSAATKPGFLLEVSALLAGLAEFRVTGDELRMQAEGSSPHFAAKLRDTALILDRFRQETRDNYLVGDEIPELLCKKLECYDKKPLSLLDGASFWLDGFSGFTHWEMQIVREIIRRAKKVDLAFTVNNHITTQQKSLIEKISQSAKEVEKIVLKSSCENSGELVELRRFFEEKPFASNRTCYSDIHVIEAAEPYAECLAAADAVLCLHSRHGCKFNEIAIVADEKAVYEKNLVSIFARLNIPLFVDSNESILSHPLTEFLLSALDIVLYGKRYEDVFRFLKTGLSPLHDDYVLHLENYVLANGICSYKWQYGFVTEKAESARKALVLALAPIWMFSPKKNDLVANFAKQMYQILDENRVQDKLAVLANNALLYGRPQEASWHTQVWKGLCDALDKYVEILGGHRVSLKTFADSLKAGFGKVMPGRLPPTSNQVMLGDTSRSRYPEIKAMIVLGASEGSFPKTTTYSGLFSENEKTILKNSGLEIAKEKIEKTYEQDYNIYRTLTKPSEKLYILYSKTNGEGKQTKPARVLTRILKSLGGIKITKPPEYTEFGIKEGTLFSHILGEASKKLLVGNVFSSSITRLESYARCPYMYFCRYILGAKERDIYDILPRDLGRYLHDAIAGFTKRVMDSKLLPGEDEIKQITGELVGETIKGTALHTDSSRNRHITKMLANTTEATCTALLAHLKRGRFSPVKVEENAEMAIPLLDGNLLRVYGRIDRVDVNPENYVKVMDYKSSDTGLSFSEVSDGVKLQLMLYLKSEATGGKKPGGAFYFTMQNPILDTDTSLEPQELTDGLLRCFRMSGVVSERVVHDMDTSLADGESSVIPVRLKKDGGFWKNNSVLEDSRLDLFVSEAESAAKKITGKILSGNMKPEPYKTNKLMQCDFCEYALACQY